MCNHTLDCNRVCACVETDCDMPGCSRGKVSRYLNDLLVAARDINLTRDLSRAARYQPVKVGHH